MLMLAAKAAVLRVFEAFLGKILTPGPSQTSSALRAPSPKEKGKGRYLFKNFRSR
jgi:hypothetical protein